MMKSRNWFYTWDNPFLRSHNQRTVVDLVLQSLSIQLNHSKISFILPIRTHLQLHLWSPNDLMRFIRSPTKCAKIFAISCLGMFLYFLWSIIFSDDIQLKSSSQNKDLTILKKVISSIKWCNAKENRVFGFAIREAFLVYL